ncbi:MAG: hypothetical protein IKE37_05945 [Firmicutes bacterium]|nr:hypothetical protein [Bacillota bacterium]
MKKRSILAVLLIALMIFAAGCGSKEPADNGGGQEQQEQQEEQQQESSGDSQIADSSEMTEVEDVVEDWMVPIEGKDLKDGTYDVTVSCSSSMFKISSCELTVANGEMTAVMTMGGKGYRYVFPGTGEEAVAAAEADYVLPVEDASGAHTFTIPVEALDKGIDLAAFSDKKEKWYERTLVFRSDSLPLDAFADGILNTAESLALADGEYTVAVELSGGSGKASVDSPAKLVVSGGKCTLTVGWSSPNYDYMVVEGEKYLPVNTEGNSVFEIPVSVFDRFITVLADTTAMSTPHEIEYKIRLDSASIQ